MLDPGDPEVNAEACLFPLLMLLAFTFGYWLRGEHDKRDRERGLL